MYMAILLTRVCIGDWGHFVILSVCVSVSECASIWCCVCVCACVCVCVCVCVAVCACVVCVCVCVCLCVCDFAPTYASVCFIIVRVSMLYMCIDMQVNVSQCVVRCLSV